MTESERISWVLHNKKQILFEDYSGLNGKEMLAVLHASEEIFDSLREPVPVLLDFNGATIRISPVWATTARCAECGSFRKIPAR